MDKIHEILECHERWIESLIPHVTKPSDWDSILHHVCRNVELNDKMYCAKLKREELKKLKGV